MLCSYLAPGEENKAASSHGPTGDHVEWVFAKSTSPVAAEYVKPVHANFCHNAVRGTTVLRNQADRETLAWHSISFDPWICYISSEHRARNEPFQPCEMQIYGL